MSLEKCIELLLVKHGMRLIEQNGCIYYNLSKLDETGLMANFSKELDKANNIIKQGDNHDEL